MSERTVFQSMSHKHVLSLGPNASVWEAACVMTKANCGSVLIVDTSGQMQGIVTERDLMTRVLAKARNPEQTKVSEVMTKNPITVDADDVFGYALILMHEHGFRHVPVMEHDRLIGIVSARDALNPDLEEFVVEAERRKHFLRPNA